MARRPYFARSPEALGEVRFVERLGERVVVFDLLVGDQPRQLLVELLHSEVLTDAHRAGDLMILRFADEVRDRVAADEDLERRDPPAGNLLEQRLRHHALEDVGEDGANLRLLLRREQAEDPVDGGDGGRGVQTR